MTGISFHAYTGHDRDLDIGGYGLGFFGAQGSGSVVQIGEWQKTTYIVDGDVPVSQVNNITYHGSTSGIVEGSVPLLLTHIPNYQATLNIRFTPENPARVVNARCSLFDGITETEAPHGWTARIAEIAHTSAIQGAGGRGDTSWHVASTGEYVDLWDNPGPGGANVARYAMSGETSHDWFVAISVSPDQVGSRHAGLYVYLEYL
jgi:hypothetical protein